MRDGLDYRAVPLEAEIAVARDDRDARDHCRPNSRTVHVQLLIANPVGNSPVKLDDLGTEDVPVKGVGTFEIGDSDHDVVQAHARTIRASGRTDTRHERGVE
jgi:hypothetical protein